MRIVKSAIVAAALSVAAFTAPAWSLSEIQREELPAPQQPDAKPSSPTTTGPAPTLPPADTPGEEAAPAGEGTGSETAEPGDTTVGGAENAPIPEVSYDLAALPEPVRRMHALLIEACKAADIERLRSLVGTGDSATQLSLGDVDGDVIDFLKQSSGDGEGLEILAILEEVLSAGYVHTDAGSPEELYVWPYFFAIPLDKLTGRQKVELYKIVTSSDVEEMKTFGAYIFYRVGITPEGRWAFFVAGD